MKTLKECQTVPVEILADSKSRLQIPYFIRQMFDWGPGTRFAMYITRDEEIYFKVVEK